MRAVLLRRALKYLAISLAVLVLIMVLAAGAILIAGNTNPGRRLVEALAPRLTGGTVRIEGLSGRFPDAVRARTLTIADRDGVWLTIDEAALDWSPLSLLRGVLSVARLEVRDVRVGRPPVGGNSEGGTVPMLPAAVSHLHVGRLEIAAPVAGRPLVLGADGSGRFDGSATGEAHLAMTDLEPREGSAEPNAAARDHYTVDVSIVPSRVHATIDVAEGPGGLLAGLADLPDLGRVVIGASVDGPMDALATKAAIEAGPLRAGLDGTVDMRARRVDLSVSANAPAMTPRPGLGWGSIRLAGTVRGPFLGFDAEGTLSADDLTASGAGVRSVRALVSGSATGQTTLHASFDGLTVPGPTPDLLAGGALTLDATGDPRDANRAVQFSLRHALFAAEGTANAGQGQVRLTVPDLGPFAAAGGVSVKGQTSLDIHAERDKDGFDVTVKGGVDLAGGEYPIPALVGHTGAIDLAASISGDNVGLTRLFLSGEAFKASATGQLLRSGIDADWTLSLDDLSALRPDLAGSIQAHGHASESYATGSPDAVSVTGDLTGDAATRGEHLDRFTAHLAIGGPPGALSGRATAGGTLFNAPLDVEATAERHAGGLHVAIAHATWKSLTSAGTLDFADGQTLPAGSLSLAMTRLADLAPLLGRPVEGSVTASLDASPGAARINATLTGGKVAAVGAVGKAVLAATVTEPAGDAVVDGTLTLDRVEANGVRAAGRLTGKGPLDELKLVLTATGADPHGAPIRADAAGTWNGASKALSLTSSQDEWGRETVRLLAPVRIALDRGVMVDRLRLGIRQGELTVVGGLDTGAGASGLDLRATLRGLPADVLMGIATGDGADGTITGDARLTGGVDRPAGSIHLAATGFRWHADPWRALPPAAATAAMTLDGSGARVDARLTAGGSNLTMGGRVPLNVSGPVDLQAGGVLDLAMLGPMLEAQGREVRGRADVAMRVGGTLAAPKPSGTVRLSNGDFEDAGLGVHIAAIGADGRIDGDTIRVDRFEGKAGQGALSGSGTIGIAATPVADLTLRASNARILATDLITATVDADLTLHGTPGSNPVLAGTVRTRSAEIRVPEKMPPNIATIPVRVAGAPPPKTPPPSSVPDVSLNVTLDAPGQIYVRGRGLNAELGGKVTFAGSASHVSPLGALKLRRGTFDLAGQTMLLTEGTIDFAGGSLTNPPLKLVATSTTTALTATLTISGDVKNPKVVLSSVPDLPQDEILSQLLFNTTRSRLSPFQVAQIAAALASISGVGSSITDPLGSVRSALGLDQLSVGSDASGGSTLQLGRYVAPGVRVGAAQSASGTGTQAQVQIDIAKGLKLETTVGSGTAQTTGSTSGGTSVGVTYEFEY